MSFLYPNFLFALFAISIPIIIHFFNFKSYKTVYFSNITFLKDVKSQTRSKSNLKHLLVLLMRILTIAAIVTAFAKPYFPVSKSADENNTKAIGIYIDNSFSTQSDGKYGKIIETSKNKALKIVEAYPENQKFFLINNDFQAKYSKAVSAEQFKDYVQEIQISPNTKKTGEILSYFKKNSENQNALLYIISDFQKTTTDLPDLPKDSLLKIVLIPEQSEILNNIIIDSVWFDNPNRPLNQTDQINVSITNFSDQEFIDIPLNLFLNDTLKAPAGFNIKAKESIVKNISFINNQRGSINGKVQITDYPVIFDNDFYFSFNISEQKNVLIIGNQAESKFISSVFEDDKFFKIAYENSDNVKVSEIFKQDLVFINNITNISDAMSQELGNFCKAGGTVILFPPMSNDYETINKFLTQTGTDYITGNDTTRVNIENINYNARVLTNIFQQKPENIDFPYIKKQVVFSDNNFLDREVILWSEKNERILSKYKIAKGNFYLFSITADQNSGNLVFHPLWAPLIYNIALYSNIPEKNFYTIGENKPVIFNDKQQTAETVRNYFIKSIDNTIEFIPESNSVNSEELKLFVGNNINKAGNYYIGNENRIISSIAFNYNRQESDLDLYTEDELSEICSNSAEISMLIEQESALTAVIQGQTEGLQLWRYFIWAALIFIIFEIIAIRIIV